MGENVVAAVVLGSVGAFIIGVSSYFYIQDSKAARAPKPIDLPSKPSEANVESSKSLNKTASKANIDFSNILTFEQVPLNKPVTLLTAWGVTYPNVIINQKTLTTRNNALSADLTFADGKTRSFYVLPETHTVAMVRFILN